MSEGTDQQPGATQVTIPVTIQTVDTTQTQQIAIPIGLQTSAEGVAIQHIQQLQEAQQLHVTQLQVEQIQQQQISDATQLEQQQQETVEKEVAPAAPNEENVSSVPVSIQQAENGDAPLNESVSSLNDSTVSSESEPPKKKSKWTKYVKRYNKKWESEPGLKEWIRRVPGDDTKVSCRYCQNTIRAHHTELKRHSLSAKHKSQAAYVVGAIVLLSFYSITIQLQGDSGIQIKSKDY